MPSSRLKGFKRGGKRGRGRGRGRGRTPMRPVISGAATNGLDSLILTDDETPVVVEDDVSPLTKFMNITKADKVVAHNYLSTCNDDLNEAIAMFCQSSSPMTPSTQSSPHTAAATQQQSEEDNPAPLSPTTYEKTFGVRPPKPRVKERLIEEPRETIRDYRNLSKRKLPESIFSEDYSLSNPSKKSKQLHELYKVPVDITYKGTFDQAKKHAKQSDRWLIVNIQDTTDFKSHCINRDIWRNSIIRNQLENNFSLWQVNKDSSDACWYSKFYDVCSLPYIAILDSTTGKLLKEIQTTNPEVFIALIEEFLCNFVITSSSTPAVSNTPFEDEDFKAAISASLVSSKQNGKVSNNTSLADAPTSSKSYDDEFTEDKPIPWVESEYTPSLIPGDSVTRIIIRCLDGARRAVTFSQSQPIKDLFDYLLIHGMDSSELEILSTYPRMVLNNTDPLTSFKDAQLAPSATLFIQFP
ncbi:hypothetical protein LOD99_4105 [Oopsacas minuta]|uniref:UBX domain-containing protein n=1 Tax=Oopsacas minuta TaxID=111878 RepID=A0AAV7JW53_9METZ|nr:hypothetical protein LOD99_4105 [Oopsacas minuta]